MNGVSTNYTLDLNSGLTQVLTDGTNTYTYGPSTGSGGRISQEQSGNDPEYFLTDALGSVRQMTSHTVLTFGVRKADRSPTPNRTIPMAW
jgi:hypothetical protein